MKFIQLTDDDITELNNIINCLTSKDEETFKLGRSLLEVKFGIDFWIPINDIFIPFEPYYNRLQYPFLYEYVYSDNSFIIQILGYLIESKYYAIM